MNLDPKPEAESEPLAGSGQPWLVMIFASALFAVSLYFGIMQFLERNWWVALVSILLSLMAIPFADNTFPTRGRIGVSSMMPFVLLGIILHVGIYLLLFYFDWFRVIFNSKSSGPLGMIAAVLTGICTGGLAGFIVVRKTGLLDEIEDPKPGNDSVDEKRLPT